MIRRELPRSENADSSLAALPPEAVEDSPSGSEPRLRVLHHRQESLVGWRIQMAVALRQALVGPAADVDHVGWLGRERAPVSHADLDGLVPIGPSSFYESSAHVTVAGLRDAAAARFFGMSDGAITSHWIFSPASWRCSTWPHGPAS